MADDEDRLARALSCEAVDRAERARQDLIERLAAWPGDETVVAPVRETAGLVERRPGAVADVDLAKLREGLDGNSLPLRDHLRGVAGSREIARNDPVELHRSELVGHGFGLLPAPCGERRVRLSGEDAGGVALALTMAHEIEGRWLHDSSRRSARSVQPVTRVIRSPFTSRFQGWSNRNTRTPDCASVCEMTTSSSQNASSSSSFARRTLYSADPELVALLWRHTLEPRDGGVVPRATFLLRQKMPADLALVGKLNVEFLREAAQIRDGADRHDVVEVDADLHATARSVQRPTRMTALKTQCAATLVASVPVATRKAAITRPPAKTTTSAPSAAGMMSTTGSDVFITVNHATVPCQSANVSAEAVTAVRTRYRASSPPSREPRKAISSGSTAPSGRKRAMCRASSSLETRASGA